MFGNLAKQAAERKKQKNLLVQLRWSGLDVGGSDTRRLDYEVARYCFSGQEAGRGQSILSVALDKHNGAGRSLFNGEIVLPSNLLIHCVPQVG